MVHAKARFSDTASPIEVDYLNLVGKGKGSISLGFLRWNGDVAVYCMTSLAAQEAVAHSADGRGNNSCLIADLV